MIYKDGGYNAVVTIESKIIDSNEALIFNIKLPSGETKQVTLKYLVQPENPDIMDISTQIHQIREPADKTKQSTALKPDAFKIINPSRIIIP